MKKMYKLLLVVLTTLSISVSAWANDTISFTWMVETTEYPKSFGFVATEGKSFAINWGDGNINTYTAEDGYMPIEHTYAAAGSYPVSMVGASADCRFKEMEIWQGLTALDISRSTALTILDCENNRLTHLDVSKNTALTGLNCSDNLLTSLDVSKNTALTWLYCSFNQLTTLNIRPCTALLYFSCSHNRLTNLDISQNTLLTSLSCDANQLTSLDISANTALNYATCRDNAIPLSDLFAVSQKIINTSSKLLGAQYRIPVSINKNVATQLTPSLTLGGINTAFWVSKVGSTALLGTDYTLSNGNITFLTDGIYSITMTNSAISSYASYPAKLIATYIVGTSEKQAIALTWNVQEGSLYKSLTLMATNGQTFVVDWGDGKKDTCIGQGNGNDVYPNHIYTSTGAYNVKLTALGAGCFFTKMSLTYSNNTTALDVSKSPSLIELNCIDAFLTNLDISKNTELTTLYCRNNFLTNLDISHNKALSALYCENNQLQALDISQNTLLQKITCQNNAIPLAGLYAISQQISVADQKTLGAQNLSPVNVALSVPVTITPSATLGGINTAFAVNKLGGTAVSGTDYTRSGTSITFLTGGVYTIIMTNSAISSYSSSPAQVIATYYAGGTPEKQSFSFSWKAGTGMKRFTTQATNGKIFIVNWGDGKTDTCTGRGIDQNTLSHTYASAGTYAVVVTAGNTDCFFNRIYISGQSATAMDIAKAIALTEISCGENELTSLDLSKNKALTYVSCYNNYLKISTFPARGTWSTYSYTPQKTSAGSPIAYTDSVNLSSEYSRLIGVTTINTVYNWFDITSGTETSVSGVTHKGNGVFKFAASLAGKMLRCKMTNAHFSDLVSNPIIYEVAITAGAYHEQDKEALRAFLRQPSIDEGYTNAEASGLVLADTLSWTTSESWVTKVYGLTWNNDIPKRLTVINWEDMGFTGNLSLVACTELTSLQCNANHQLSNLNIAGLNKLTKVICDQNNLSAINLSGLTKLTYLSCSYQNQNQLTSLDLSQNPALTTLYCDRNQITNLNLSQNPNLTTVSCSNNQLKFSTLPLTLPVGGYYTYSPQNKINGGNIAYTAGINLSTEHSINGKTTTYAWYEVNGSTETAITLSGTNGIFTLTAAHMGKTLRCKMSNAQFPNFSGNSLLVYEVTVNSLHFAGGEGTQANPYQIKTAQQLDSVRYFLDKHYIVKNNIDLAAFITAKYGTDGWQPIGNNANPFSGQIHGSKYAVSNLRINRPATDYIGLFGFVAASAKIDSLGIVNADIKGKDYVGSMAGYLKGNMTACYATGNVQSSGNIGGLVGINEGPITACYAVCNVEGESAGGLVGYGGALIENCYAMGNVRAAGDGYAGGLAALSMESGIYQCYATGNVEGNLSVGGITGRTESYLANCVAVNASLVGHLDDGDYRINRIVGDDEGAFSNNYAWENMLVNGSLRNSDNPNDRDGAGKPWADLQKQNTYTTLSSQWNFTNTWSIWENNSLPYLKWQSAPVSVSSVSLTQISGNVQNAAITDSLAVYQIKNGLQYLGKVSSFAGNSFSFTFPVALNKGDTLSVIAYEKNKSRSYPVQTRVPNAVTGFAVVQDTVSLLITKSFQLASQFTPANATNQSINWQSRNSNVASVDNVGKITAKTGGNTWVVATTVDGGFKDSVLVKVDNLCGGTGSQQQPLLICTGKQLSNVREFLYNDNIHFRLANDIDLTDYLRDSANGWLPIGANSDYYFSGQIHGGGHVITGLRINRPNDNAGLFTGTYSSAVIDSLGIEIAYGDSIKGSEAGGLVVSNSGDISHCYVSGLVIGASTGSYTETGGLAGSNSGLISHCYTLDEVRSMSESTGGLVGRNSGTITSSYSASHVNANGAGNSVYAGGLVGYNDYSTSKIEYCYASGNVSAPKNDAQIGGLVGYMFNGVIQNNIAANAKLSGISNSICRILGGMYTGTLANNYALDSMKIKGTAVTGGHIASSMHGAARSIAQLCAQTTYAGFGWNFTSAWTIWESKSYPYFPYQSAPVANAKAVAGGLTFDLRNNAAQIKVFNPRTRTETNFTMGLTAGTKTLTYASQPNDTLLITVYESGKALSYPVSVVTQAPVYNEQDKEALRAFLRQPSSEAAKCNALQLGLTLSDTANWQTDEAWVAKVAGLTWNSDTPKRLTNINWNGKLIAGNLNVSNCTALLELYGYNTAISALDVSNCTVLSLLRCDNTTISTLDVTKCTALRFLYCYKTAITTLDVTKNTVLEDLRFHNTAISTLDVTKCTALKTLLCYNTSISVLDISQCTALKNLHCYNTNLKFSTLPLALPVSGGEYNYAPQKKINSGNISYTAGINLSSEHIINGNTTTYAWNEVNGSTETAIMLSGSNGIFTLTPAHIGKTLRCKMSNAQFPAFAGNDLLVYEATVTAGTYNEQDKEALRAFLRQPSSEAAKCNAQQLGLVVSDTANWQTDETWVAKVEGLTWNSDMPKKLTQVSWNYMGIAGNLSLSNCTALTYLDCGQNQLSDLNINTNTALTTLFCGFNQLSALDVSKNTALIQLECYNNLLTSLDINKNTALISFDCYSNHLTSLDINKNTALVGFDCSSNQLTSLDVSKNTALTTLFCGSNSLTSLNISANTALTSLGCSSNRLASLNVSQNTALTSLWSEKNQLKFSTLPQKQAGWTTYSYAPQDTIRGGNINYTAGINLSSEYSINGKTTTYAWYEVNGSTETAITLSGTNGVFTLTSAHIGKTLRCKMSNAQFPDFAGNDLLVYEANIVGTLSTYTLKASAGTGGIITPTGDSMVVLGNNITYTITPNAGYKIAQVLVDDVNDVSAVASGTYTFNNVTATHTITAQFEKLTYQITASAGTNGTITPVGDSIVAYGETITYIITPNTGYKIAQVLVDGLNDVSAVTSGTYTFNNVIATHTITAQFEKLTYKITASAGTGGTITPIGDSIVAHGESIAYTIIPNNGYEVNDVFVNGSTVGAVTTYTFSNVMANASIIASFKTAQVEQFSIVSSVNGVGGNISPLGSTLVNKGGTQTYTITANTGYKIAQVLIDGVSDVSAITSGTYTFNNVMAMHTIAAQFEKSVGINELTNKNNMIKIYPNPVTGGKLKVENEEWEKISQLPIQIYNIAGKLMGTYEITGQLTELDILHLANGIYLLKIGNSVNKIVKQ